MGNYEYKIKSNIRTQWNQQTKDQVFIECHITKVPLTQIWVQIPFIGVHNIFNGKLQ